MANPSPDGSSSPRFHYARIVVAITFGWIFAGHQIGAAMAAYGAGASRTILGTYLPAFFTPDMLSFLSALLIMTVQKNRSLSGQPA